MSGHFPPEILLPYELYPYLITQTGDEEYAVTVLPLLCERVEGYFIDPCMKNLFIEFARLTAQQAGVGHWVVLDDDHDIYINKSGQAEDHPLPEFGYVVDVDHMEDPGSFREILVSMIKGPLLQGRHLDPEWSCTKFEYGTGVEAFDFGAVIRKESIVGAPGLREMAIWVFCAITGRPAASDGRLVLVGAKDRDDLLFLGKWLQQWGLQAERPPVDFGLYVVRPVWVNVRSCWFMDVNGQYSGKMYKRCVDESITVRAGFHFTPKLILKP